MTESLFTDTTESPMLISALAPWFGGKRTLAPRIVDALGPHRAYWELFAGSMAVLMAKPQATMETVNDLHGDLVNLARVVRHPQLGPSLYRRLRRTWMHIDTFHEAAEPIRADRHWDDDEPSVDRAWSYFVVSWVGRNGVAGTSSYNAGFCKRFTKNGGHAAKRFASAVDSIPAWRRRLRNVTILREDAIGLLDRIEDADGVAIYLDPPYLEKGAKYDHDFVSEDHRRLAESACRFRKTRVVVSYYDDPTLDEMYEGWTKIDCTTTKAMVNQGRRDKLGAVKAPEVLLVNREAA